MKKTPKLVALLALSFALSCSKYKLPDAPAAADSGAANNSGSPTSAAIEPTDGDKNSPPTDSTDATSTVSSPFQLSLSQSALNAILLHGAVMTSLQGEIKQDLPNTSITSPFEVSISGIHLDVKYAFNTPKLNARTQEWEFTTKDISADLTVDSIAANEVIQAGDDGASIGIRINASCNQMRLTLPAGSSHAIGAIQLSLAGGKPTLQLTSFKPVWGPSAWQVTSMNCQGAQGFGDLVSKQAIETLSQVNPFVAQIQEEIQAELSQLVTGPIRFAMNVSPSVSLALSAESFTSPSASQPGPVVIQGQADFVFNKIPESSGCARQVPAYDAMTSPSIRPAVSGDMLSLPLETVQALITCAYYEQALNVEFDSAQVPAFKSLVSSWFDDILVWPNLLAFKDGSIFDFHLKTLTAPSFSHAYAAGPHQIGLDADLPLQLEVDAPAKGGLEPYVRFQTHFIGAVQLDVMNNTALVRTMNNSALKLQYKYDPFYVQEHHPDQRIWIQPIESAANHYLGTTGLNFALPTIKVGTDLILIPQSADLDRTNVDLALKLEHI